MTEYKERYLRESKTAVERVQNRRYALEDFENWLDGEEPNLTVSQLEAENIDDWLSWMSEETDYADNTVRTRWQNLKPYIKFVFKREGRDFEKFLGNINKSLIPDRTAERSKKTTDKDSYLEVEEFKQILENCTSLRQRLVHLALWETGVRIGELSDIKLRHIDRENNRIEIRTYKREDHTRYVYYGPPLRNTFRDWIDRGGRDQYNKAAESDYLIVGDQSAHLTTQSIRDIFKKPIPDDLQEVIDHTSSGNPVNTITPHTYRRSYAIHRVKDGMSLAEISKLLGHADIQQTRDKYLKFAEDDMKHSNRQHRPNL